MILIRFNINFKKLKPFLIHDQIDCTLLQLKRSFTFISPGLNIFHDKKRQQQAEELLQPFLNYISRHNARISILQGYVINFVLKVILPPVAGKIKK